MNYTSINEAYNLNEHIDTEYNLINDDNNNDNNDDNDNNNTINAKKLLKDYKYLIKILNENKNFSINLDKQKENIINYKCNIYLNHQKILIQVK